MARKINIQTTKKQRQRRFTTPELEVGKLHIYTDGSCYPNPGPGGWGALLLWPKKDGEIAERELYGGAPDQTNNTMEMMAIVEGLRARSRDVPTIVYSDSKYCVNVLSRWWKLWERNGWKTSAGDDVRNQKLIVTALSVITPNVTLRWVKGHAGISYNERVDELASKGRREHGAKRLKRKAEIT